MLVMQHEIERQYPAILFSLEDAVSLERLRQAPRELLEEGPHT